MRCPICASLCNDGLDGLYDDRYGYPGFFRLMRCAGCGHKMLSADFSAEELASLYTDYYPRSEFDVERHQPHKEVRGFKAWLDGAFCAAFRWVPENVRVLDIGCGFGETLGYFKARGCDAYGVEADRNILRVAERFGYKVHAGLFDPGLYEPGFFDYVAMSQVIEHVKDPVETLKGVAEVLKPGGVAILSTPNSSGWGAKVFGRRWINWHAPYHLQHFSPKSMAAAAEKAGFKMERFMTITSSEWLYYQFIHMAAYPAMGEPSGFWSRRGRITRRQAVFIKIFDLLRKAKFFHLATRLFDGLKAGDSMIFMLRKAR